VRTNIDDYEDAASIVNALSRLSNRYKLYPQDSIHRELALAFGIRTINQFNPKDPTEFDTWLQAKSLSGLRYYFEPCINNRIDFDGVSSSNPLDNHVIDFVVIVVFDRHLVPDMVLQIPWKILPTLMEWDPDTERWCAKLTDELKSRSKILYEL
jgi:hypothetical protein